MSTSRLNKNVYGSFIDNSQKLEITQISISKRMDKQVVVYSDNGILLSNMKEKRTTTNNNNMAESHRHDAKSH